MQLNVSKKQIETIVAEKIHAFLLHAELSDNAPATARCVKFDEV